jgi:hypothetical protein
VPWKFPAGIPDREVKMLKEWMRSEMTTETVFTRTGKEAGFFVVTTAAP